MAALSCYFFFRSDTPSIFLDTHAELGLMGRSMIMIHLTAAWTVISDTICLREAETNNSLSFLTDLLKVYHNKDCGLNQQERIRFLKTIRYKIFIADKGAPQVALQSQCLEMLAFVVYVWNNNVSSAKLVWAAVNTLFWLLEVHYGVRHVFGIYTGYTIITDYACARLDSIVMRMKAMTINAESITNLHREIDSFVKQVQGYNKTLRPMLRNLMFIFRGSITCVLVMLTIESNALVKMMSGLYAFGCLLAIVVPGFHIGKLNERTHHLHDVLCSFYCKSVQTQISFKTRIMTRLSIKEFGTHHEDGHFVIGFSDGNGPRITRLEMLILSLDTVCNVFMILQIVENLS
jgi:hypothetical protein